MKGVYIMALVYDLFWTLSISMVAYGQPGFISLDCGGEESYNDTHNIQWTSDQQYIQTGEKATIAPANMNKEVERPLSQLRFFSNGKRNCYRLPTERGDKYIIRASFMYGNYDGRQSQPVFDLLIDANYWDTVVIQTKEDIITKEVIVMARSTSISVCVARSGDDNDKNTTFISSLELRPIMPSMYDLEGNKASIYDFKGVEGNYSLINVLREDYGLVSTSSLRYPKDEFDRIWLAKGSNTLLYGNATGDFESAGKGLLEIPSSVMRTALMTNSSSKSLSLCWRVPRSGTYLFVIGFAEVENRPPNTIREFDVTTSSIQSSPVTITLSEYRASNTFYQTLVNLTVGKIFYFLNATSRSTLGPLVNAWEIYEYSGPLKNGTYAEDAAAVSDIAKSFNLEKEWTGDPCLPQKYSWDWVVCTQSSSPRITQVKLSGKSLNGTIPLSFGNLSALVNLDLGGNNLNGSIPNGLGQLSKLKELNLSNNKLSGSVPNALLYKQRKGQLVLSINGNENICQRGACEGTNEIKSRKVLVISLVTVGFAAVAAIAALIVFIKRKSIKGETKPSSLVVINIDASRSFSYEEVRVMTDGFRKEIGKGGYGPVFHGFFRDKEVAVKILSDKSHQGAAEFSTEVDMLSKIHHKNLVKFLGYCTERQNMILIYEYMSNGDLRRLLEGKISSGDAKNWESRLNIALDAAQGLEYLHMGCRPAIIHRDIKSSNILLNDQMEAKIADFGLSKMGPLDGATHVSTLVKGTTGYLDPEYFTRRRLTEKSDVYSFGIVLMEIISGRRPVFVEPSVGEEVHIASWIREEVLKGDIDSIADPNLVKVYNNEAMWKMAELAIACTSPHSINRPAMSDVVLELREAIRLQTSFYVEMEVSEMGSLSDSQVVSLR